MDYFAQLSVEIEVKRNDVSLTEIDHGNYCGVVLSPGPEKPDSAGNLMAITSHFLARLPILGICLGHQALGIASGAQLIKAAKPMHGKLSEIMTEPGILFDGISKKIEVVRYHSLILKDVPEAYVATASTQSKELMAMESIGLKACGIQFHPEAVLTEYGLQMLRNWVSFYNIV